MAPGRLALGAIAGLLCCSSYVNGETVDVPSPANYVRRSTTKATVLGNYVYVDGGELSQLVDGTLPTQGPKSFQVNSTLSIDLSTSWNTSTVRINAIPKPLSKKANVQLWTDHDAGVFYSWGGKWILGIDMIETQLLKFTADGQGGGTWAIEQPANPSLFKDLHPAEFGAVANTADTGFSIGGMASGWTEKYRGNTQVLPGMLAFNMKTKVWQNGTAGFSPYDRIVGGIAHYVPMFGAGSSSSSSSGSGNSSNGLIVVMGGVAPRADAEPDVPSAPSFDLRNLTFFDPQTKKAYSQVTTGDIPPSPRSDFGVAGFKGSNGTYEIFIFGGRDVRDKLSFNDAYLLSLPGFVWTKLPDAPAGPRSDPACVAVGNRQVLSIGGADPYKDTFTATDSAPQGLLVFDVTAMKWKDDYDAQAAAYESPDPVKKWYDSGSLANVKWTSDEVKGLFSVASTSAGSTQSTSPASNPSSPSSSPPAGAIAGGVVGGLAVLAIIAAGVWLFIRKRKQRAARGPYQLAASELGTSEAYTTGSKQEAKYVYGSPPQEVDTNKPYFEVDDGRPHQYPPVELDGGYGRR